MEACPSFLLDLAPSAFDFADFALHLFTVINHEYSYMLSPVSLPGKWLNLRRLWEISDIDIHLGVEFLGHLIFEQLRTVLKSSHTILHSHHH